MDTVFSASPYTALVIGASGGIGAAIAKTIGEDPLCQGLETLSRRNDGIDLRDEASVANAARSLEGKTFDLIFNASGVLDADGRGPEKAFRDISPETMADIFAVNAIGTALAFKHFTPLLKKRQRTVFATLSARVGSIGDNNLGGWVSYRASKAALNQIVRCAAIEEKRRNPEAVVVALHPGTIETPLTTKFARGRYTATPEDAAHNLLWLCFNLSAVQSGQFFDYAGEAVDW